MLISIFDVLLA